MKYKNLTLKNNINSKNLKIDSKNLLSKKFEEIYPNIKSDIKNTRKTLNILDKNYKFNFELKDLKKFQKFKTIAIVGMGGSILGTEAIYNFFKIKIKKKIFFFNNLDDTEIINFKKKINLSKALFIIISKSGNTIETLSNAFLLNILKKNSKNIILISEKKNNSLYFLSQKLNLFYVEHKSSIGGRYSVLSEVGIIPAYLMGINIKKLRLKILECVKKKNKIFLKNSIIQLTQILNTKKFNNLIFLNYVPELEKFLYWCQQLIAESLGKKNKGFLPMVSNVPKDHHSLLQLYLDGPKDKLFVIFNLDKTSKEIVKFNKNIGISFLNKKNLNVIKNAQKNALIKSLKKKKYRTENL